MTTRISKYILPAIPMFRKVGMIVALTCVLQVCLFAQGNTVLVSAGRDTAICKSASLALKNIGAFIVGEVNDGTWFTTGDGIFSPGNTSTGQYSLTISYIPGLSDVAKGYVDLILVSFDPDGLGPKVQVSDMMRLSLISDPPMVCNTNLNVSLAANCSQEILASMVLSNPQGNIRDYTVQLFDNGVALPSNVITRAYINKTLEYKVTYSCGTNSCWGKISAQDKEAPRLRCRDTTIECTSSILPDSLGFPISNGGSISQLGNTRYLLSNGDNCGKAELIYTDEVIKQQCIVDGMIHRLVRKWEAVDDAGNKSSCTQIIYVRAKPLSAINLPPNYDDLSQPAFICGSNFKQLSTGSPSPEVAGAPTAKGCTNLEFTYTDQILPVCGNSIKIIRKWLMVDWCNSTTKEHIQILKVLDKTPPKVTCARDTVYKTTAYECNTGIIGLPAPTIIDECGAAGTYTVQLFDSLGKAKNEFLTILPNGNYNLTNLGLGKYRVVYKGFDQCGNFDTCSTSLRVIDDQPPFVVCAQKIVANFNETDDLRLYPDAVDKGSIDNCGIAKYEVAKMTDPCLGNQNKFGNFVTFCCEELGTVVMVALKVTDLSGNANTCMIEVTVLDKKAPIITCPPAITVSCDYPIDLKQMDEFGRVVADSFKRATIKINDKVNNGAILGKDGYAIDNCKVVITEKIQDLRKCRKGDIRRTFYATDASGNVDSCVQIIKVIDTNPFSLKDITWPIDTTLQRCGPSQVDTSISGRPRLANITCAVIVADYEDIVFETQDASCYKIVRQWTVVDWCKYENGDNSGTWKYDQIIKLTNVIAPTFVNACKDTSLCMFTTACGPQRYQYAIKAKDDCTPDSLLRYKWQIDLDNNGSQDITGISKTVDGMISAGTHKVTIEVFDICGNKVACSYLIKAKDCKPPTPYCIESLSTAIMSTNGEVTIWASDLNRSSTDNCTPSSKLIYSFSKDTSNTKRVIRCADLANGRTQQFTFQVWVTDADGNQDFCTSNLTVQDNNNVCKANTLPTSIQGYALDIFGQPVLDLSVTLKDTTNAIIKNIVTKENNYSFANLVAGSKYRFEITKEDNYVTNVNVLDILTLQRHTLSIQKITNPVALLAGDVDGNGSVNIGDIVEMRKLILGITDKYNKAGPAWNFIRADYLFDNPLRPNYSFNFLETSQLRDTAVNTVNVTAYKMGDVSSIGNTALEARSNISFITKNLIDSETLFSLTHPAQLSALEILIDGNDIDVNDIQILPKLAADSYFHQVNSDQIKLICYLPEAAMYIDSEPIITIANTTNKSVTISGIAMLDDHITTISIKNSTPFSISNFKSWQVGNQIQIEANDIINVTSEAIIFDIYGRQISRFVLPQGMKSHRIEAPAQKGIYVISLFADRSKVSNKIFISNQY